MAHTEHALRRDLPLPIPPRMLARPRDARGYPTPFFVAWIDGAPDFRVVDPARFSQCIKRRLCWTCGQALGRHLGFVLGPMCVVTRTSSEPPCHVDCAEWALKACPFMVRPKAKRRDANLPEELVDAPGVHIKRNPGCGALYVTKSYQLFRASDGVLIRVGPPERVEWFAEGRAARREEVLQSIESGLPLLREADGNDPEANAEIDRRFAMIMRFLPERLPDDDYGAGDQQDDLSGPAAQRRGI